jgi:hypothetical protein
MDKIVSHRNYDTNLQFAFNVFVWYASSVVYTNSSKSITPYIGAINLTLLQLCFASVASYILITVVKIVPLKPLNTVQLRKLLPLLGLCFAAGFSTFNLALQMMHVSTELRTCQACALVFLHLPDIDIELCRSQQRWCSERLSLSPLSS